MLRPPGLFSPDRGSRKGNNYTRRPQDYRENENVDQRWISLRGGGKGTSSGSSFIPNAVNSAPSSSTTPGVRHARTGGANKKGQGQGGKGGATSKGNKGPSSTRFSRQDQEQQEQLQHFPTGSTPPPTPLPGPGLFPFPFQHQSQPGAAQFPPNFLDIFPPGLPLPPFFQQPGLLQQGVVLAGGAAAPTFAATTPSPAGRGPAPAQLLVDAPSPINVPVPPTPTGNLAFYDFGVDYDLQQHKSSTGTTYSDPWFPVPTPQGTAAAAGVAEDGDARTLPRPAGSTCAASSNADEGGPPPKVEAQTANTAPSTTRRNTTQEQGEEDTTPSTSLFDCFLFSTSSSKDDHGAAGGHQHDKNQNQEPDSEPAQPGGSVGTDENAGGVQQKRSTTREAPGHLHDGTPSVAVERHHQTTATTRTTEPSAIGADERAFALAHAIRDLVTQTPNSATASNSVSAGTTTGPHPTGSTTSPGDAVRPPPAGQQAERTTTAHRPNIEPLFGRRQQKAQQAAYYLDEVERAFVESYGLQKHRDPYY